MPYTYRSLVVVWLIAFALAGLAGSGMVTGLGLLPLLVIGLLAPGLILKAPAVVTSQLAEGSPGARDGRA